MIEKRDAAAIERGDLAYDTTGIWLAAIKFGRMFWM